MEETPVGAVAGGFLRCALIYEGKQFGSIAPHA